MQIPTSIEQLWGTPDLLPLEDSVAYKALWMDIAKDIEPSDVIEWLWINDILELSWEIRRLRRLKKEVMSKSFSFAYGDSFESGLVHYKTLNVLEATAEARRNAVFREIESRRNILAGRIRKASNSIIEGYATEQNLPLTPPAHVPPPPHVPPTRVSPPPPPVLG